MTDPNNINGVETVADSAFLDVLPGGSPVVKAGIDCDVDSDDELYELYEAVPLLGHICDFYPTKMLKDQFIDIKTGDDDLDTDITRSFFSWLDDNDVTDALRKALIRTNINGTYLVLIDVEENGETDTARELNPENVKRLVKLTGVNFSLAKTIVRDTDEDYDLGVNGTYYKIGDQEWHASRVFRFDTGITTEDNTGGSTSLIKKILPAYNYYESTLSTVSRIATSTSIPVLGIEGLTHKLGTREQKEKIRARLEMVKQSIYSMGTIAIDNKTETFEYVERTLNGLDTLVQIAKDRLCTDTRIPETFLFMRSSTGGGLSDDGFGERSIVAATTADQQNKDLRDVINFLLDLWAKLTNTTTNITFEFAPTLEMTRKEVAEVEKLEAETKRIGEDDPDPLTGATPDPSPPIDDSEQDQPEVVEGDGLGKPQAPGKSGAMTPLSLSLWGSLKELTLDEGEPVDITGSKLTQNQQTELIERGVTLLTLREMRAQTRRVLRRNGADLYPTQELIGDDDATQIFDILNTWNATRVEEFDRTVTKLVKGNLTLSSFESQMIESIMKSSMILANGFVPDDFFDSDDAQGFVDLIAEQMTELIGYLNTMIGDVSGEGEISEPLLRYRIKRYIDYQNSFLHESFRLINVLAGATEERRLLDPRVEHCFPCVEYSRAGWVPVYTLPVPRQLCPCANNCRCRMRFR